ncbi:MAG: hypothetical protein QM532_00520, partial [Cyanobium sp. MAG06]|nr:hypothetical protein [Cyanobium sp. MAG06]
PVQEFRNQMMQISKDHDMDIRIKRLLIKDFLIGEHGILKNTTNTMDGKEYYTLLELKGH